MMKCWRCGERMELTTNGNGQLVNRCGNCGRTGKPIQRIRVSPRKRPDDDSSPYLKEDR